MRLDPLYCRMAVGCDSLYTFKVDERKEREERKKGDLGPVSLLPFITGFNGEMPASNDERYLDIVCHTRNFETFSYNIV